MFVFSPKRLTKNEKVGNNLFSTAFFYLFEVCLREALCTSGVAKSKLSVRSSVRPFVRKIIDFCRKEIGSGHILRSLDEMEGRFSAISKLNPHSTRLATDKRTFRDPTLDPVLVIFFSKVNKNVTDRDNRVSG